MVRIKYIYEVRSVRSKSGVLCNKAYPSEIYLGPQSRENSIVHNLFRSHPIVLIFCTAVILSCSVQPFKTIRQLKRILWTNEISRDLHHWPFVKCVCRSPVESGLVFCKVDVSLISINKIIRNMWTECSIWINDKVLHTACQNFIQVSDEIPLSYNYICIMLCCKNSSDCFLL